MTDIVIPLWDGVDTTDIIGERIFNAVAETIALKSNTVALDASDIYPFNSSFVGLNAVGSPTAVGTPSIDNTVFKLGTGSAKFVGDGGIKYGTRVIPAGFGDYSVMGWLRSDLSNSINTFVAQYSNNENTGRVFGLYVSNTGSIRLADRGALTGDGLADFWPSADGLILANTFYHISLVFDGTARTAVLKINDAPVAWIKAPNVLFNLLYTGTPETTIGMITPTGNRPLVGYTDELILMPRKLTDAEITENYNGGAGKEVTLYPDTSPSPVSIWTATGLGTVDMSTFRTPENNNTGDAGSVKYQYAFNGSALNGTWLTQAQMQALGIITITDAVNSVKFVAQYISDGSQKTTTRAFATIEFTPTVGGSQADPSDVRFNTVYNDGALTGTAHMVTAPDTREGVLTDDTVGTLAVAGPTNVRRAIPTDDTVGVYDPADPTLYAQNQQYGANGTEFTGSKTVTQFETPVEIILEDPEIIIYEGCD